MDSSKVVVMELAQTRFFTPRNQHLILGVLVALSLSLPVDGWVVPQPKANVWATLAKAMNQDHICLSATSANNPLSTCLVGIPFRLNEFPPIFLQKMRSANQRIGREKLLQIRQFRKEILKHWNPIVTPKLYIGPKSKGVAVTIFLPWVAIAKSLGELAHLECWVAKQANLTSEALSNLLNEEEITRQATLQNRAAIDYLLLLHGHRCEEFEGLCCFNLTSRAEDVHAAIQKMKEMVGNIKRETEDWLGGLFENWGISSWVSSIINNVLLCLFVLLLVILGFGLLKRMLYKLVSTSHSPTINHLVASLEDHREEEELDLEEVLEGAPDDEEGRNPDEEEHRLGYPTQHH
ncbi:hypothetical protein DUI87_19561 [Hirundo rustica rustica]|uniref:Envelope glycoprotein n=1 Tax=Hirundo rustica rustica TaxID=333673 RepID=A0A3M0JS96_HIRRU|nr:hypothetical protein DUI87_19561 [Hirundo rustica rustica]